MHAAISTKKRDQSIPMLAVVPATAPQYDEITEKQPLKKEKSFNLQMPDLTSGKAVALDVLTSALGSGSGTDEITRRERAAYGSATTALNEDKNTRALRVYMNNQILPRLKNKLRTCTIKYRILLVIEILLALISMVIFGVTVSNDTETAVNTWIKEKGLKVGMSVISMVCTLVLLFVSRVVGALSELIKRLKREIIKRETYNHVAEAMVVETKTQDTDAVTRESTRRDTAWISAPGTVIPVGGWQLQAV
ncbi:NS3 [CHeRI orbivirus 3-3]|nr:NS3 [CHeRI orbivirus 3-3]